MGSIYPITAPMLQDQVLREHIYPDLEQTLFWDASWDPELYVELARAGFISIAYSDSELGAVLIPELQGSYAVLDWVDLHCSRKLRRLLRSGRLADEGIELRVVASVERVLERLVSYHEESWILEPYRELVLRLPTGNAPRFALHGVELWSGRRGELVAGELGYTIGATYTSLSGFCSPHDRTCRHFGTLQLFLLAEMLRDRGYAFWNMGHPGQDYKVALGARVIERGGFLERWLAAREATPTLPLGEPTHSR